jgi:hypothetical protein
VSLSEKKSLRVGESPAHDELESFESFFINHWKNIVIFGVVLILGIGIAMWIETRISADNADASSALISADTIEELEAALKKYSSQKAADFAKLRLGTLFFEKKDYAKALEIFSNLATNCRNAELKAQASLNEACTIEQNGNSDNAAEKYASIAVSEMFPVKYRIEASYFAARIYISKNKINQAKSYFDLIKELSPPGVQTDPYAQKAEIIRTLYGKVLFEDKKP